MFVFLVVYNGDEILLILLQRDQYNLFQRKRVGQVDDDRVKFELSTMLSREVMC